MFFFFAIILPHNKTLALIYDTIESLIKSVHWGYDGGTIARDGRKIGGLFLVKIAFPKPENRASFASV